MALQQFRKHGGAHVVEIQFDDQPFLLAEAPLGGAEPRQIDQGRVACCEWPRARPVEPRVQPVAHGAPGRGPFRRRKPVRVQIEQFEIESTLPRLDQRNAGEQVAVRQLPLRVPGGIGFLRLHAPATSEAVGSRAAQAFGDFVVEFAAQAVQRILQRGPQPFLLGAADLADPVVLNHHQRAAQNRQQAHEHPGKPGLL